MDNKFFLLLQINDASFPIGGYAHSYGLETYIQKGSIIDAESALKYIKQNVRTSFLYSELLAASIAFDAAGKPDIERVLVLEEKVFASKSPMEMRLASQKLGSRFIKTASAILPSGNVFLEYQNAVGKNGASHAVAYGVFCADAGFEKSQAMSAYLYAQVSSMVTNCVKTVPLSQTAGQQMLATCYTLFDEILVKLEKLNLDDLCRSCPGLDIRCMQHEKLYSRLYMS